MKFIFIVVFSFFCVQAFLCFQIFDGRAKESDSLLMFQSYLNKTPKLDASNYASVVLAQQSNVTDGLKNNLLSAETIIGLENTNTSASSPNTAAKFNDNGIITVNNVAYPESSYSLERLMNDVLLKGGCTDISKVSESVYGDAQNIQGKSYGYFTKGSASGFPFEKGIILSTGSAASAGNITNSEAISTRQNRPGDPDLEAALGMVKTEDATSIKFVFTPDTDNISFRYIMASEEYDRGDYECQYSDGFAFLLREVGTSVYQNLAVLPDGTPVSVSNISNGTKCSNNSEYFEGYNLGQTNFDGQTKVLTASATVIPHRAYEIKLVVADQRDNRWDSAIFLEAGTFNLGSGLAAALGEDLTIADNTAGCFEQSVTLDTKLNYGLHTWYHDNILIEGETGPTINVSSPGTYKVDVVFPGGCKTDDSVMVEFFPPLAISTPDNLIGCKSVHGIFSFDLTLNDAIVLGALDPLEYLVSYYEVLAEAKDGSNPISSTTNYPGIDNQIIFVRVENTSNGCFTTDSFILTTAEDSLLVLDEGTFTAEVVSEKFSKVNTIMATMIGDGIYEYSLDGFEWQVNNTFNGVAPGRHVVRVRDLSSCGVASTNVTVVDYPRFFTPNNDTYNDTWNIVGSDELESANIYIFDRYGKLLKQMSSKGSGWDGTFNGKLMPNSDYWFVLQYREPETGERKEFKAHFTLKR